MFKHDLGEGADLRILEPRHAAEFLNFLDHNREHLGTWLDWAQTIQSLEEAQHFIRRGITRYSEDGLPWVGIWQDGKMAGGILFFPVERVGNLPLSTEIGYWLGRKASGRGLMTRAARAMLGFVFEELGINRVQLRAEVGNAPSRRVAERLGFTFEGIRRQDWVRPHGFVDMACYSLLASDWRASRP
ncbi:MAG TPA: GNAT family protein [Meiothermus sp.]|nr:GNAT family protein [Meiothermus sp.]